MVDWYFLDFIPDLNRFWHNVEVLDRLSLAFILVLVNRTHIVPFPMKIGL